VVFPSEQTISSVRPLQTLPCTLLDPFRSENKERPCITFDPKSENTVGTVDSLEFVLSGVKFISMVGYKDLEMVAVNLKLMGVRIRV